MGKTNSISFAILLEAGMALANSGKDHRAGPKPNAARQTQKDRRHQSPVDQRGLTPRTHPTN
ncbi:MAG: hypothetical protein GXP03_05460 [Alphaproteobacteria bacterium]|nr:hypothetical protein [Alphaproteobacteria bacterium]